MHLKKLNCKYDTSDKKIEITMAQRIIYLNSTGSTSTLAQNTINLENKTMNITLPYAEKSKYGNSIVENNKYNKIVRDCR